MPRHAPPGVRAGGRGLVNVLEEINTGVWLGKTLSGRTAGLGSLSVGKALTLGCAPYHLLGNLIQKCLFERTLFQL